MGLDRHWVFQDFEALRYQDIGHINVLVLSVLHIGLCSLLKILLVLICVRGWFDSRHKVAPGGFCEWRIPTRGLPVISRTVFIDRCVLLHYLQVYNFRRVSYSFWSMFLIINFFKIALLFLSNLWILIFLKLIFSGKLVGVSAFVVTKFSYPFTFIP
jgi:hypothetical protein